MEDAPGSARTLTQNCRARLNLDRRRRDEDGKGSLKPGLRRWLFRVMFRAVSWRSCGRSMAATTRFALPPAPVRDYPAVADRSGRLP